MQCELLLHRFSYSRDSQNTLHATRLDFSIVSSNQSSALPSQRTSSYAAESSTNLLSLAFPAWIFLLVEQEASAESTVVSLQRRQTDGGGDSWEKSGGDGEHAIMQSTEARQNSRMRRRSKKMRSSFRVVGD